MCVQFLLIYRTVTRNTHYIHYKQKRKWDKLKRIKLLQLISIPFYLIFYLCSKMQQVKTVICIKKYKNYNYRKKLLQAATTVSRNNDCVAGRCNAHQSLFRSKQLIIPLPLIGIRLVLSSTLQVVTAGVRAVLYEFVYNTICTS